MSSEASLHLGDCLDVFPTLSSIDAVVSDPPYGMDWDTGHARFRGESENNRRGGKRWECRIEGDDQSFDPSPWLVFPKVILWGSNHFASRLPVGTTLVWVKRNEHAYGTFLSDAEIAWMKGGHGVYLQKYLAKHELRCGRVHPSQKPVALMRWCIERLKLNPGATILDPYMGSGTTGVAAVELGFNFVGIESHEPYFRIAEKRIADARSDAASCLFIA